ncbi:hypothetical protein UFOVP1020_31 [uncultured Caudovirales phage]|uniref:DNA transfer protein n=1 Tax=uncultured Caudovirales phage TaxID=2100421 RepID=A0A6J5QTW9_9CAUD|nr:hypothetical protein UFOVP512_36 [uncultured Caudovirales phage]CAB4178690.1 hypothetical protein UFOVP1020_31 [uncultured Caudovirales phage]CAB4187983.1 hypothetical protein UFOVP1170_26 [uncultured Caudovirales phage]CAB4220349.1 hypothetical protein UFOVP1621_19 [uncultured Caudovirales phage]
MAIFSTLAGMIGQQGAQQGAEMAWGAANQANQQNITEAGKARAQASPWTGSGTAALGKITQLLGLGELTQRGNDYGQYWVDAANAKGLQKTALADFETSPGYQWRLDEGGRALDRSAASKGMVRSGAQTKAITAFGQGAASEEYGNYFNQLSTAAGQGNSAQAQASGTAAGLIGQGGNYLTQGGAARGSGYAAGANALASGISSGVNNVMAGAYLGYNKKNGIFT